MRRLINYYEKIENTHARYMELWKDYGVTNLSSNQSLRLHEYKVYHLITGGAGDQI